MTRQKQGLGMRALLSGLAIQDHLMTTLPSRSRSKLPHQGAKECARRRKQAGLEEYRP